MKRDIRLETLGFRLQTSIQLAALLLAALPSFALTEGNPYSAISGRNTFALKPPAVAPPTNVLPPTPAPNVSLQGISTILGRAQALLKVKIAPKPPEAAKEMSLVMDIGQREGDVEVLAIDANDGSVRLNNQGSIVTLNIKDGDKPIAGPVIPSVTPLLPGMANLPSGIPTQSLPPAFTLSNKAAGTGLPGILPSPVPTRPLRPTAPGAASTAPAGGLTSSSTAQSSYNPPNSGLSVDEQVAILAVQHKAQEGNTSGPPLPPIPSQYLVK